MHDDVCKLLQSRSEKMCCMCGCVWVCNKKTNVAKCYKLIMNMGDVCYFYNFGFWNHCKIKQKNVNGQGTL